MNDSPSTAPSPGTPTPAGPAELPSLLSPALVAPPVRWREDLRRTARQEWSWLWQGYLRPGGVTLLTSLWKTGKTTLLSHLLAHMKAGGHFLGQQVAPARVAVLSEEGPEIWDERSERLGLDTHVCWQ